MPASALSVQKHQDRKLSSPKTKSTSCGREDLVWTTSVTPMSGRVWTNSSHFLQAKNR